MTLPTPTKAPRLAGRLAERRTRAMVQAIALVIGAAATVVGFVESVSTGVAVGLLALLGLVVVKVALVANSTAVSAWMKSYSVDGRVTELVATRQDETSAPPTVATDERVRALRTEFTGTAMALQYQLEDADRRLAVVERMVEPVDVNSAVLLQRLTALEEEVRDAGR